MPDKEKFLGRISGSQGTYFGKVSYKIKDFLHNHGYICFCHWPVLGTPKQAASYTPMSSPLLGDGARIEITNGDRSYSYIPMEQFHRRIVKAILAGVHPCKHRSWTNYVADENKLPALIERKTALLLALRCLTSMLKGPINSSGLQGARSLQPQHSCEARCVVLS